MTDWLRDLGWTAIYAFLLLVLAVISWWEYSRYQVRQFTDRQAKALRDSQRLHETFRHRVRWMEDITPKGDPGDVD